MGNAISVTDIDAGNGNGFNVRLTIANGTLALVSSAGVTVSGNGALATPLVLNGTLPAINAALAAGVVATKSANFFGSTLLTIISNDNGNTGTGGALTDTDSFVIKFTDVNIAPVNSLPPDFATKLRSTTYSYANSNAISVADLDAGDANNMSVKLTVANGILTFAFATDVDFPNLQVDGNGTAAVSLQGSLSDINAALARGIRHDLTQGYVLPEGTLQLETLPWVNLDRLKVVFTEDVGRSLTLSDFSLTPSPGYTALGIPVGTLPKILNYSYDSNTFTASLALSKPLPAAVFDLSIASIGVFDREAAKLDGEWIDGVTTGSSGNGNAGGDFSFRIFVLPGDTRDESGGVGTRTVNSNDSQRVRDKQNGFVVAGVGDIGYEARADLDGSAFINAADSQYVRDQQNAIIYRSSGRSFLQNPANRRDVDNDGFISPLDVLIVINALNKGGEGEEPSKAPSAYLDVTGDEDLSPLDALTVINWLNGDTTGDVPFETGEGESASEGESSGFGEGESTSFELGDANGRQSMTAAASSFWAAYGAPRIADKRSQLLETSQSFLATSPPSLDYVSALPQGFEWLRPSLVVNSDVCFDEELNISEEADLEDTLEMLVKNASL